jgi:hypothetical protein
VSVTGAGRVEQRSNGRGWAQGVCRGKSSNREAPGVCEAARGEGRQKSEGEFAKERSRKNKKRLHPVQKQLIEGRSIPGKQRSIRALSPKFIRALTTHFGLRPFFVKIMKKEAMR